MTRQLRILLVQGHRNTSGGDPAEAAMTPRAARAIQSALQAAGHTAHMLQGLNDWFDGSLDAVGRAVTERHRQQRYDVMLDIHFEGDAANTRGVFAIVPDGDGLRTYTPYDGSDSWTTNPLDVQIARAIAEGIHESTGLAIRSGGTREPGVMSEKQTYVGSSLGARLAMFGYTAPVRDSLVRLVIECGNIRGDADIIGQDGFFARLGAGVVLGLSRCYDDPAAALPASSPVIPALGALVTLREPRLVTVKVEQLNVRRWADLHQPIMDVYPRDKQFWARGWVVGERVEGNPLWWITGKGSRADKQWRVWSGGTDLDIVGMLALPAQEAVR